MSANTIEDLTDDEIDELASKRQRLRDSVTVNVDVDVPPEVWETAWETVGLVNSNIHDELRDYLDLEFRFLVEGEEKYRTVGYDDEPEPVTDGGVSKAARQVALVLDVDPERLQSAADAVGEPVDEYVRTAFEFRRTSDNAEEFGELVDRVDSDA